jgi:hypothetical protein
MKFISAIIVGYYFIIVSFVFAIGSISIIVFSLFINNESRISIWLFNILIFLCVVCFFSAKCYIKKSKIGRYLLIFFASFQILISMKDIIVTYKVLDSFYFINIFFLLLGLICLQHLLSKHSKEWVKSAAH